MPYPCRGGVHLIPSHKLPNPASFQVCTSDLTAGIHSFDSQICWQGEYTKNNVLQKATRLFQGELHGAGKFEWRIATAKAKQ